MAWMILMVTSSSQIRKKKLLPFGSRDMSHPMMVYYSNTGNLFSLTIHPPLTLFPMCNRLSCF